MVVIKRVDCSSFTDFLKFVLHSTSINATITTGLIFSIKL